MSDTTNFGEAPRVTVIVGATSKWQPDGPNTVFAHGAAAADPGPASSRWGVGGAVAQRFAGAGDHVVLTTRTRENARGLAKHIRDSGGLCTVVELDVASEASVAEAFAGIRSAAGEPSTVLYNAGYMAGRQLPPESELLEFFPTELFDVALSIACRGPFLVAKEVLPSMRQRGTGALFFTNNQYSLRGRKRNTGESLYFPRTMMRALSQALVEEYAPLGVHVANVVVDGFIDSPGTRALPRFMEDPTQLIDPSRIAEAIHFLRDQDPSCWTYEIQLTASPCLPSH